MWCQQRMALGLRTVSLQGSAVKCQCSWQKKTTPAGSCPREAMECFTWLQRNRGRLREINPDLLPGWTAGVKDFHQIAVGSVNKHSQGGRIPAPRPPLIPIVFPFQLKYPFILTFYDEKFQIYRKVNKNKHVAAITNIVILISFIPACISNIWPFHFT